MLFLHVLAGVRWLLYDVRRRQRGHCVAYVTPREP